MLTFEATSQNVLTFLHTRFSLGDINEKLRTLICVKVLDLSSSSREREFKKMNEHIDSNLNASCFSPEGHDVAVGAETGHARALAHLDHVGPQDEGGLRDVVFVDARLGRQGHDFGLFLRAYHSVLDLVEVLGHGGGHRDGPALADLFSLLAIRCGVGLIPGLVGVGQQRT